MENVPVGLDMPGGAVGFEDVTSIFEEAAGGTLSFLNLLIR